MSGLSSTRSRLAAALLLALAAAACRRTSGPPPERFVSRAAAGWVVIPELRRAGRELAALHETVSTFPGAAQQLAGARGALTAQLGFDPLDADALARAGIEPARGAALASEPEQDGAGRMPLAILPVRDAAALEGVVARLARERLGAPERVESTQGAVRVVTFRPAGGTPALSLGVLSRERTAALAPGAAGPAAVVAALSRAPADSLAESSTYRELRKALGERYAAIAGGSPPASPEAPLGRAGLGVGLSADAGLVRLGLASLLGDHPEAFRALRASGDSRAAVRSLSPDAALVLRWDGDPGELGKRLVGRMAPQDVAWLAAHGFDPQRDLFDRLAPGTAASVSISPRLDLTDLSDTTLRADPLRVVRFELAGEVKDEAATRASLARLPALFVALQEAGGVKPAKADGDGSGAAGRIPTPSGEIAWKLSGKRLAMAGGPPGALDALLARQGGGAGFAAPTKTAAAALEGGLGGAVLAPRSLVASVRALPGDSFGTGPTGFVVRSIVERFLEPADRISAVSVRADLLETALTVDVVVEAPAPGKEAK